MPCKSLKYLKILLFKNVDQEKGRLIASFLAAAELPFNPRADVGNLISRSLVQQSSVFLSLVMSAFFVSLVRKLVV
jgi:hypothetical protein